jgi:hypothetical protein
MPLGAFRQSLNLANPSGGGGDAPLIPTLTWSRGAWHTGTFNNTTRYATAAIVGLRADGWHYLFGRGDSSNGRFVHNDSRNLSMTLSLAQAPIAAQSTSLFSTNNSRSGTTITLYSATNGNLRATIGAVANWATTPTQTSTPVGAVGTVLYGRSGATNSNMAITICPLSGSNQLRAIGFWNNTVSTVRHTKLIANSAASTFTNQSSSTTGLDTGATSINDFMGAAGFTSNDNNGRWILGGFNGTSYRVSGGSTSFNFFNDAGTTSWTNTAALTVTTVSGGGLAPAWDDFTNSKQVAVAMVLDGTTVKARAIKYSDGTMGTANNSVVTGVFQAKISRVNTTSSNGFGMVLITYLKTSSTTDIYGRFVSVDSTTLALTVGAEMFIGVTAGGYTIGATPSYGIDCVKDGTNWAFQAVWALGANNNGGASFSTATG